MLLDSVCVVSLRLVAGRARMRVSCAMSASSTVGGLRAGVSGGGLADVNTSNHTDAG